MHTKLYPWSPELGKFCCVLGGYIYCDHRSIHLLWWVYLNFLIFAFHLTSLGLWFSYPNRSSGYQPENLCPWTIPPRSIFVYRRYSGRHMDRIHFHSVHASSAQSCQFPNIELRARCCWHCSDVFPWVLDRVGAEMVHGSR